MYLLLCHHFPPLNKILFTKVRIKSFSQMLKLNNACNFRSANLGFLDLFFVTYGHQVMYFVVLPLYFIFLQQLQIGTKTQNLYKTSLEWLTVEMPRIVYHRLNCKKLAREKYIYNFLSKSTTLLVYPQQFKVYPQPFRTYRAIP